eukprot:Gb_05620 [translate_table: standard]
MQHLNQDEGSYEIALAYDGHGTLRQACKRKEPLWIVFEVSGTIHLSSYLRVSSYKTIDGRGQRIKLAGKGLQLKECEHVIINNLEFEGGRGPDVDGIQIKPNSRHIWIDRCSLRNYDDGLIDITRQSTDITISSPCNHPSLASAPRATVLSTQCLYDFPPRTRVHCKVLRLHQRHPPASWWLLNFASSLAGSEGGLVASSIGASEMLFCGQFAILVLWRVLVELLGVALPLIVGRSVGVCFKCSVVAIWLGYSALTVSSLVQCADLAPTFLDSFKGFVPPSVWGILDHFVFCSWLQLAWGSSL